MRPETPAAQWQDAAQHLLALQRPEQAEQLVRQQLARNPREVAAYILLGFALYHQHRLSEARVVTREALALNPAASEALYVLCLIENRDGQLGAMQTALREALRLQPFNPKYLSLQARLHLHHGRPAEAQAAAEQGLSTKPTHADCLLARAEALRDRQQWPELAATLQQLLAAHPNLPSAHRLLGQEAMRQRRFGAAQAHFQEVLRLNPLDAEALREASQAIRRQLLIGRWAFGLDRYLTFVSEGTRQGKLKAWGHFLLLLIPLSLLCVPILLFLGIEAVYWRLHPAVRRLRNRPDAATSYLQETLYRYGAAAALSLLVLALLPGFIWGLLRLGFPESSLGPGLTGGLTTVVVAILGVFKQAADGPVPEKSPLGWLVLAAFLLAGSITAACWPATWPYGPPLTLLVAAGLLVYAFRKSRAKNLP